MTATSSPTQPHYHHMGEPVSSPEVIAFFAERERLLAETSELKRRRETEKEIRRAAARRHHGTFERLEGWLYSLLSAAALAGLLWSILGLADFATPQTKGAGSLGKQAETTAAPHGRLAPFARQ